MEFACRVFNILRENRNILIHAHSIFPTQQKGAKPEWRRATGRGPVGHTSALADLRDLADLIACVVKLGLFVVDLVPLVRPRNNKQYVFPEKFAFPSKLRKVETKE